MKKILSAFVIGSIFGLGLTISEMVNPAKVLGFLDLFGAWDPSLILVMGGALLVTAVGYRLIWRRGKPLWGERFDVPKNTDLDKRLLGYRIRMQALTDLFAVDAARGDTIHSNPVTGEIPR